MKWLASVAIAMVLLTNSVAAEAHAQLVSSNPKISAALKKLPATVQITFDDDLIKMAGANIIQVRNPKNVQIQTGTTSIVGATISIKIKSSTLLGKYRLDWRALSADGHPVSGYYFFYLVKN